MVSAKKPKIAVVGGGLIGLTSALVLSKDYDVTIFAERVGVLSESNKATAIWHVYLVPETEEILKWSQVTLEKLCFLSKKESESGIEIVKGVELFRRGNAQVPSWAHIPPLFKMLSEEEVSAYNMYSLSNLAEFEFNLLKRNPVIWGYHIEAPAASMQIYLPWLEEKVINRGVGIEIKHINNLDDLSNDFDAIINCTGFGARELANDVDFIAYKGQYFVLKGSDLSPNTYVGDDDHPGGMAYMIPRLGEIMVGGCAEKDREDLELTLNWDDTIRRAGLYVPWLKTTSFIDQARNPVVGIRPCRITGVRLEIDLESAKVPIIHNYGHGGSGFSLSWGCAEAVSKLVAQL